MTDPQSSSFNSNFVHSHLIFTRALKVIMEHSSNFMKVGFSDEITKFGYVCYVQSFLSLLHAHHIVEDEALFPYFCDKMPDKNFQALTDQHNWMIPILEAMSIALEKITGSTQPADPINDLTIACAKILELWRYHSKTEEIYLSSAQVNAVINTQEQNGLNKLIAEYNQKLSGPDYLVIPFMLYNLPTQERTLLSHSFPDTVTQQLVPVTWKEKWGVMLPFLLD